MSDKVLAMMEAAQRGELKRLALLLKTTDPKIRDAQGWTPLHWAVQENHFKVTDLLIQAGAIVDAMDDEGISPLIIATGEGHVDLVRKLIAHGADVNQRCPQNKEATPLHLACAYNHLATAKALISSGSNINAADLSMRTPLFIAVMYGHQKIVKLLLMHGAIVELEHRDSEEGKSLAEHAKATGNAALIGLLVSAQSQGQSHD